MAAALASASERPTAPSPSGLPSEKANPALVVARASNPAPARSRAEPASQGLGSRKQPARSCRARKARARSSWVDMGTIIPGRRRGGPGGDWLSWMEMSFDREDRPAERQAEGGSKMGGDLRIPEEGTGA